MTLNIDVLEEYVNGFVRSNTSLTSKLTIERSSRILLLDNKGGNCIYIGEPAITLMLLFSCFAKDSRLFRKTLFFFYWTYKNLIQYKLEGAVRCCLALSKEVGKKAHQIYGYAQQFQNDLLIFYLVGHEAAHLCFADDKNYREKAISEVLSIFDDVKEMSDSFPRSIQRQLINDSIKGFSIDALSEEFACDRESIKFLYRTFVDSSDLSSDALQETLRQIMDMTMMFQYDVNMSELQVFNLKKARFNHYLSNHIGKGVLRSVNAAFTLRDLSGYGELSRSFFEDSVRKQQKTLSGYLTFNIFDVGIAVRSEDVCFDLDKINELSSTLSEVNDYLSRLLLGESLE